MDLSILNKQQQEAVLTTEGPLLVLAGAGSGKTRVLTHRIAYLIQEKGVSPYAILALTFTNKAAGEMRERVERLIGMSAADMWVMTFHSFCARILRMEIERLGYARTFVIYDDADSQSLIKKVIKDLNLNDKVFPPRALLSRISDAKNHSLNPDVYLREAYEPQQVLDAYSLYQKQLRQNNAVDFDDLLLLTFRLFEEHPDVLQRYQRRFRYILVDEYQDTNMTQYRITELLARAHQNLCVVGDDDQSIYAWRGADIRNILEFEKNFDNVHVIRLEQNYRSTDRILDCANAVIANNHARKKKTLWTGRTGGAPIQLYEAIDERDEANYICSRILDGVRSGGRSYDDYAILYRTHAQSRQLEMQLKGYDIPYRVYGGTSFFQRAEVKDVLAYLRLLHNPADNIAFLRIVNVPRRGIGQAALDALQSLADEQNMPLFTAAATADALAPKIAAKFRAFAELILGVYQDITLHPLGDTTEALLAAIGYDAYLREDRKENYEARAEVVKELIGYIRELTDTVDPATTDPLAILLENVALFATADNIDEHDGSVSLMTLHSAKGLEFPSVFLTGLEEGLFPSSQSRFEPDRLEEERRLCYVGVTRAKDELCLTCAKQRMLYGKITPAAPSCFLNEMASSLPESARPAAPKRPRITESAAPTSMHTLTKPARGTSAVPVSPVFAAGGAPRSIDLAVGQKVRHKTFGDGTVLNVTGSGNNQIVEISFFSGVTKKFAASYAPIETIGG